MHLLLWHALFDRQSELKTPFVEGQRLSEDYGKDLTSVQNLQMKHVLLDADVGTHQDRIDRIRISSEQFVNAGHFDAENISWRKKHKQDLDDSLQAHQ